MSIRSCFLLSFMVLSLGAAPSVRADDLPSSEAELSLATYSPLESLKGGLEYLGDRESGKRLAVGLVALAGARVGDEEANDFFRGQHRIGDWDRLGNDVLGTGVPGVLIAGGFWLYGDLRGSAYESHAGQAQIESLFVTSILTAVIKGAGQRERPDGSDRYSFPSGHTSTVFASATALHQFYGWKVGVPAYALGVLTGVSRMSSGRHWLSDVTGGALLGYMVGQAYSRYHLGSKKSASDASVAWWPVLSDESARLVVRAEF